MKLSDIFNINLNTGGGNKLFARIMNKYNVPKKEYKDIRKGLKEESGNSSSDMEYYKVNGGMQTSEIVALYKIENSSGIKIQGIAEEHARYTIAIAYAPISDEGIIYYSLKDYFKHQVPNMSDEEIENIFNSSFTPITKEEFYDLNNI